MRASSWILVAILTVGWSWREWTNRVGTGAWPRIPSQMALWPGKGEPDTQNWRYLGTDEAKTFNFWLGQSDRSGCWLAVSDRGERTLMLFVTPALKSMAVYDDRYPRYELPLGPILPNNSRPSQHSGPLRLYDWNGGSNNAGKFSAWEVSDDNVDGVAEVRTMSSVLPNLKEVFIEGKFQPLDRVAPDAGFKNSIGGHPIEFYEGQYRFKSGL